MKYTLEALNYSTWEWEPVKSFYSYEAAYATCLHLQEFYKNHGAGAEMRIVEI